jgi:hypothetical protein
MSEHALVWVAGVLAGVVAVLAGAVATRVQLLPDVIDVTIVPTAAGIGGLVSAAVGAAMRFDPDRLGRITLLGNLLGGAVALLSLLLALLLDVFS